MQLNDATENTRVPDGDSSRTSGDGGTLLLISSEAEVKDSLSARLSPGFSIALAPNLTQAFQLMRLVEVKLILCTVPSRNGSIFENLDSLKTNPLSRKLPLVCIWTRSPALRLLERDFRESTRAFGAAGFLTTFELQDPSFAVADFLRQLINVRPLYHMPDWCYGQHRLAN